MGPLLVYLWCLSRAKHEMVRECYTCHHFFIMKQHTWVTVLGWFLHSLSLLSFINKAVLSHSKGLVQWADCPPLAGWPPLLPCWYQSSLVWTRSDSFPPPQVPGQGMQKVSGLNLVEVPGYSQAQPNKRISLSDTCQQHSLRA